MTGRELVTVGYLHPGHLSACFAHSFTDMLFYDNAHDQRIVGHPFGQWAVECHAARIHNGRNEIAAGVLDHTEATWLFMVDSDMGFAPDTVDMLIASANENVRPVVGGLAFAQKTDGRGEFGAIRFRMCPTLYRMGETDDTVGFAPMFDYPEGRLVEVDATGAACLLIHRSVLVEMREAVGDRWFTPITVPKGPGGFTEFSEDMSFCLRVKALGKSVYVDTSVRTTHDKGGVFLDEVTYRQQRVPVDA